MWTSIKAAWNFVKGEVDAFLADPRLEALKTRLTQQSTWRGIAALGAVVGIGISDEQADLYYQGFLAILGLMAIFNNEPTIKA